MGWELVLTFFAVSFFHSNHTIPTQIITCLRCTANNIKHVHYNNTTFTVLCITFGSSSAHASPPLHHYYQNSCTIINNVSGSLYNHNTFAFVNGFAIQSDRSMFVSGLIAMYVLFNIRYSIHRRSIVKFNLYD